MTNNIYPIFDQLVSKEEREKYLGQVAKVFWFTGLSGSGKSTIAKGVERALFNRGYFVKVIDGDNVRVGLCNNLGFSMEDRQENIRRVAELAKLFVDTGVITMCSFISPTVEVRAAAKSIIESDRFKEIYINTPLEICEQRDVKGLYQRARKGEIPDFTGISSPYEEPENADLIIKTGELGLEECVEQVVALLESRDIIMP